MRYLSISRVSDGVELLFEDADTVDAVLIGEGDALRLAQDIDDLVTHTGSAHSHEEVLRSQAPEGAVAYKFADPTEDARWLYDLAEAERIALEDPSLIRWAYGSGVAPKPVFLRDQHGGG